MIKFKNVFLILPALCLVFAACGGSAIGDAQEFVPNEPPAIFSIKAVNMDGSEIQQLDIEPYKQFKLVVEATDPDNNPLEYKFDSASGTFAGITSNSTGCTAIFKTGRVVGGQNVEFWAGVSDGKGALVRQSYNLGTGKTGPTIVANLEKTRLRPIDKIKLTVTANCSGFFQLYSNGTGEENFEFEKDMFRYSYSENKTTEFILGGPECKSYADIQLEPRADKTYGNDTSYNIVLVFRDGLFQSDKFIQTIYVDGTGPKVTVFPPDKSSAIDFNPEITVTFDEVIGYADSSCLELTPSDGKIKLLRISENKAYFSVTGLKALTDYKAVVKRVKDIAGNEMDDSAPYTFTTISGDLQIKDKDGKTEFTTYRGFEESSVNLNATFKGKFFDIGQVDLSVDSPSNGVNVDTAGNVTINPRDLTNETDVTVKIKAYQASTEETAYYTVTINSWYPVTAASEFGNDGVIRKNLNGKFKLDNNIDFENKEITPIGSYTSSTNNNPFTGIFDGNDKPLSSFKITASADYAGLFAYNKGTIKNLNVQNANLKFTKAKYNFLGIIAGYNEGRIEACEVNKLIIKEDPYTEYSGNYIGGIAGQNKNVDDDYPGLITDCSVSSILIEAGDSSGGLVGNNTGTIENSSSSGEVTVIVDTPSAGGLVGSSLGGKITGCSSSCDVKYVTSSTNSDACAFGGLIGYVNNSVITDCFSTGTVSAGNANNVGGLIGLFESGTVSGRTYSTGAVTGNSNIGGLIGKLGTGLAIEGSSSDYISSLGTVTGNSNVGGLIGCVSSNTQINYCKSSSSVIAGTSSTQNFGGLIGYLDSSTVKNSYHETGFVSGTSPVGGLIGYAASSSAANQIESCYAKNCTVSGTSNNVGGLIGRTQNANITGKTYADCSVTGVDYVGGLIGYFNGGSLTITGAAKADGTTDDYIYTTGTVSGKQYVGGLIGNSENGLTAKYCKSSSTVSGSSDYIGGLIGSLKSSTLEYCFSENNVEAVNSVGVGGLVGNCPNEEVTISRCYHKGSVSGRTSVGGLIGFLCKGTVELSYHKTDGEDAVIGSDNVGGLIGRISANSNSKAKVDQCFAYTNVKYAIKYDGDNYGGGLIGKMEFVDISNCYSMGTVVRNETFTLSDYTGGLVGYAENTSTISYCYAVYDETTLKGRPNSNNTGGLVGGGNIDANVGIISSFHSYNGSGSSTNNYGELKPKDNLKTLTPYTSASPTWDIYFPNSGTPRIWLLEATTNDGFPYLENNPPQ